MQVFLQCDSDAERLLLLDWVAFDPAGSPYLFVEDARYDTSPPATCVASVMAFNDYAVESGVVYESGESAKGSIFAVGLSAIGRATLQHAVEGKLRHAASRYAGGVLGSLRRRGRRCCDGDSKANRAARCMGLGDNVQNSQHLKMASCGSASLLRPRSLHRRIPPRPRDRRAASRTPPQYDAVALGPSCAAGSFTA